MTGAIRPPVLAAALAALAVLAASPAVAQDSGFSDRIVAIDEKGDVQRLDRLKITSATFEKIVYDVQGRSGTERDATQVLTLSYGDAPRVFLDGIQNLAAGRADKAASDFAGAKNAVDAGKARAWLIDHASVGQGEALLAKAAADPAAAAQAATDALAAFEAALAANPRSFLYDRIRLGIAKANVHLKKWDAARAAAQDLADVGRNIKHPIWLCEGLKAVSEVLLAEGKYPEAANSFQVLQTNAGREASYTRHAGRKALLQSMEIEAAVEQGWSRVARAEATKAASEWDDAKRYFESLGARFPNNEHVAAAVLNGIGRCLMDADPRAALHRFAEAEVKHFNAKREVARALYLKAEAYELLAERKGLAYYRTMSEKARSVLRQFYGDSEWAGK